MKGMHKKTNRKQRGRTSITHEDAFSPTHPSTPLEKMTEVNRPVTASGNGNKHRGDRRDTSKYYSGNSSHRARGNTPRRDVKTRKR
jgi:hypothetical protein